MIPFTPAIQALPVVVAEGAWDWGPPGWLTLYEAAYLELALRRELPLATLDRDLRAAARAENLHLLGV